MFLDRLDLPEQKIQCNEILEDVYVFGQTEPSRADNNCLKSIFLRLFNFSLLHKNRRRRN